jgi:predicted nucleic acid-binding Zn ribbon protein
MPRGPQPMSSVMAELMARSGFARVQSTTALEAAWQGAAGTLVGPHSRAGAIRRGKLEVTVTSSTLAQELTFQKATLLEALRKSLPNETIRDLRFRVGPIH